MSAGRAEVVRTAAGPVLPILSGHIRALRQDAEVDLTISQGQWWIPESRVETWRLDELWSEDIPLRIPPIAIKSGDSAPTVRGYAYPGTFLSAKAYSGEHLSTLLAYRRPGLRSNPQESLLQHPGHLTTLSLVSGNSNSPWTYFETPAEGSGGYWITSPGYRWAYIESADLRQGNPVELLLGEGASLGLSINGFQRAYGLRIHLIQDRKLVATYMELNQSYARIDGLPAGPYEVQLSFNNSPDRRQALAWTSTSPLVPGATVHATLDMPELPSPTPSVRGEIEGTLTVEATDLWSDTAAYRQLALALTQDPPTPGFASLARSSTVATIGSMIPLEAGGGTALWSWKMSEIPAGSYSLTIQPLGISTIVDVREGRTSIMDLRIPPLARTLIEVWSGQNRVEDCLLFSATGDSLALKVESNGNLDPGTTTLVSLPGAISLHGICPTSGPVLEKASVESGWNYLRIDLAIDTARFELQAQDTKGNALTVPWFDANVTSKSGSGSVVQRYVRHQIDSATHNKQDWGVFIVTEPGEYVLSFPLSDGGTPHEQVVVAERGDPPPRHVIVISGSEATED